MSNTSEHLTFLRVEWACSPPALFSDSEICLNAPLVAWLDVSESVLYWSFVGGSFAREQSCTSSKHSTASFSVRLRPSAFLPVRLYVCVYFSHSLFFCLRIFQWSSQTAGGSASLQACQSAPNSRNVRLRYYSFILPRFQTTFIIIFLNFYSVFSSSLFFWRQLTSVAYARFSPYTVRWRKKCF